MAALKGLLDTSVVIAEGSLELPAESAISVATLAELHFGVHLAKNDDARALRLRRLAEIEDRFAALPIDREVARTYGDLARLTRGAGRKVRTRAVDLFIAATARAHGVALYTRNGRDFEIFSSVIDLRVV